MISADIAASTQDPGRRFEPATVAAKVSDLDDTTS